MHLASLACAGLCGAWGSIEGRWVLGEGGPGSAVVSQQLQVEWSQPQDLGFSCRVSFSLFLPLAVICSRAPRAGRNPESLRPGSPGNPWLKASWCPAGPPKLGAPPCPVLSLLSAPEPSVLEAVWALGVCAPMSCCGDGLLGPGAAGSPVC